MERQEPYYIPEMTPHLFYLKLSTVHVPSGTREFFLHRHFQFEFGLIKSGSGIYTTSKKTYDIKENDVFVFASNEVHFITEIDNQSEILLMNIHFEPFYLWASEWGSSQQHLDVYFRHNPQFENRLPRNHPATDKIRNLILEMNQEFYARETEYISMVRVKLTTIFVTLLRELNYGISDTNDTANKNLQHMKRIYTTMEYIQQNICSQLTLEELACIAQMSTPYFCSVFKQINSISPWKYIIEKRLEKAKRILLSPTRQNVLEIALQCGFNNTANFNRIFRKYTGLTPSEYRKRGYNSLHQ